MISVVIRCFNEQFHIGCLLCGISGQIYEPKAEIIVVDSGSTDNTLSIASKFPVKIINIAPENFSFGRALKLGIQAARGDFVVAVSAHVCPVYRNWLQKLLEPFEDPQVAVAYGKQKGNDITKYAEHRVFEQWFPEESDFDQRHTFCNNANAAIRRKVWTEIH